MNALDRNKRWSFRILLLTAGLALLLLALSLYGLSLSRTDAPDGTFYGTKLDDPPQVGDLTLTAAGGDRVALADFRGAWLLVFFGFTSCPDVCPLTMGRLAETYSDLGRPEEVQVVMVSVDPATDTPERTQAYVASFDPSFVGLSGTSAAIADAARTFFVGYRQLDRGVSHTDTVALLDPEGRMQLVYTQDKVTQIGRDLQVILNREGL